MNHKTHQVSVSSSSASLSCTDHQLSQSRYRRAFAAARSMRFWRPQIGAATVALALASAPLITHAQFPASFDLSTLNGANGFVISGVNPSDNSGRVSGAGDLNGDGIDDVIIGARVASPNGVDGAGESYVIFGRDTSDGMNGFDASFDVASLNGTNGLVINGIGNSDASGSSVSNAGDINGDGIDDAIIGAPYAGPNGIGAAGESYVIFGRDTLGGANDFDASLDLSNLNGANGFAIQGSIFGTSGFSVSGAGDINGDGIDDAVIGAPYADSARGVSYVIFGRNTSNGESGFGTTVNLGALDGDDGFALLGDISSNFAGISVSGVGDLNADGIDDLVIGASDIGGSGKSYVVYGKTGFEASLDLSNLDGTNGFEINGIYAGGAAGRSVSGAGDINGDGIDDLIIGDRRAAPDGNQNAGESYVVFGRDTTNGASEFGATLELSSLDGTSGFAIKGSETFDAVGSSVSGAGDVNGDGLDDLIVTSSNGESYVVFGIDTTDGMSTFEAVLEASSLNGVNGFLINGLRESNEVWVSDAGDVNGDGIDDIILGVTDASPNGKNTAGESYVIFGQREVPEPSGMALAFGGLLGWFTRKRR